MASPERPHVVIVGAGFGGLYAARTLGRADLQVSVIDRRNYHLFQPLLYQVATASLSPSDIAYPIRGVLRRQKNTRVFLAEATAVNLTPLPGLAPVAIQQGRHAARTILRRCRGAPSEPFRYKDRGSLATIGRAAAVAHFGAVKLSGFVAWLVWTFVHILFLIGFRNRFIVLFEWAWAYVTLQRSARLITGESKKQP